MPELRKDPVTGRWVIIATERAKRPTDFVRDKVQIHGSGFCPFCYGNEAKTPPEILAYRSDGSQREHSRVVAARGSQQISRAGHRGHA